jgi:hypothetical protein
LGGDNSYLRYDAITASAGRIYERLIKTIKPPPMFNKEKTPQGERFAPVNATLISPGTILKGDVPVITTCG